MISSSLAAIAIATALLLTACSVPSVEAFLLLKQNPHRRFRGGTAPARTSTTLHHVTPVTPAPASAARGALPSPAVAASGKKDLVADLRMSLDRISSIPTL